jgi:hypothetical protein
MNVLHLHFYELDNIKNKRECNISARVSLVEPLATNDVSKEFAAFVFKIASQKGL